jgi:hypothetical protein
MLVGALTFNMLTGIITVFDLTRPLIELLGFGGVFQFGLACVSFGWVLCQYSAIWVWMRHYFPEVRLRVLVGTLLICAVTLSVAIPYLVYFYFIVPFFRPSNPWQALGLSSLLLLLLASFFYWVHSATLTFLLSRTNLKVDLGLRTDRQYSIRRLLGWMIVVAIASLLVKYLVVRGSMPSAKEFGTWVFWTSWTAFWTGLLTYTHFASRFALASAAFRSFWWMLIVLAPLAYAGIGVAISELTFPSGAPWSFIGLLFVYLVELGFVFGTWIYFKLIPKTSF